MAGEQWNLHLLPVLVVFEALDHQECGAEDHGEDQHPLQGFLLAQMRGANRQRHGQAADDQHRGIRRAERRVHEVAGGGERIRVHAAVDRVGAKHPAEEHDFGQQEHPHSEGGRIKLLAHVIEVMT